MFNLQTKDVALFEIYFFYIFVILFFYHLFEIYQLSFYANLITHYFRKTELFLQNRPTTEHKKCVNPRLFSTPSNNTATTTAKKIPVLIRTRNRSRYSAN